MSEQQGEVARSHSLTWWGLGGTALYLILSGLYVAPRWSDILSLPPNEVGDLLAGFCSPLAFLWLVLGFLQQGQELRASVRALELQGEELRNSVEQQRQLVEVAREEMNFQMRRIAHDDEVENQKSRPIIELTCQGNASGRSSASRTHLFRVSNFGKEVRKFEVKEQGAANALGTRPMFGHGNPVDFEVDLPVEGIGQKTLRLGYLDDRGRESAEYWIIRIENGLLSFGPEDEMRGERR